MFPERLRNHLPYCLGTSDCQMENGKQNLRNTEKCLIHQCQSQRGMFQICLQATVWRKWWFSWKYKGCDEQTLYDVKGKVSLAPAHSCEQHDWWQFKADGLPVMSSSAKREIRSYLEFAICFCSFVCLFYLYPFPGDYYLKWAKGWDCRCDDNI